MEKYPNRFDITKTQLRKLGKRLAKDKNDLEALEKVNKWRASHAYPMQIIFQSVKNKSNRILTKKKPIVAQRLKRMPTIINKLNRHKDMRLSSMQDIGGVRVIFETIGDIDKFMKDTKIGNHKLIKVNNYIQNPKQDGYRGIHLIYEYCNDNKSLQYNGLFIEVQVRTILQHEWATAVEAVGISTHKHIKLGNGDKKWREFFRISSVIFSILETPNVISGGFDVQETIKNLVKIERKLNAIDYLSGLAKSINLIEEKNRKQKYFILSIDANQKKVQVYGFNNYIEANIYYEKLEHEQTKNLDSVLVSVNDIRKITKAYPNYFFDLSKFCSRIETIILAYNKTLDKNN